VALAGVLLLLFVIYVRPQEFIPALQALSLINVSTGLAVLGIIVEVATGRIKSLWSPQLPYLLGFCLWCVLATLVKVGFAPVMEMKTTVLFSTIFMLVVMYAGRSFTKFRAIALMLLGIAVFLATVCAHQGSMPFECIELEVDPETGMVAHDQSQGTPDGRSCEDRYECSKGGKAGAEYACERPGIGGTFTVAHGRVRWRGTFADPNELSLAIGAAMSFAFALHASMRRSIRHLLLIGVIGVSSYCVILSGSRGGVLVLLLVFAVYFVRRFGLKGLVVGGMGGLPLLLLGGRSGEDADSSSLERLGALYEGVDFFKSSPVFGLGQGQFLENYFITAHNSYLLSAAELGFPGFVIWGLLVYVSIKIPYVIATRPPWDIDRRLVPYAMSLAASYGGILIGIFFLSFNTHPMLFIFLGLSGALYGAAKQTSPAFDVKVTGKEVGMVTGLCALILTALFVYTRIKGNG
jgi:hypothetical protein